jgi:hypothetical protein
VLYAFMHVCSYVYACMCMTQCTLCGRTQLTGMQPIHKACMYGQMEAVNQMRELGEGGSE